MNLTNLAELNPAINYNKLQPINAKQNEYAEYNGHITYANKNTYNENDDVPNFIKFQNGLSNVKKDESYYCGGSATLANKHLHIEQSTLASLYYSQENINRIQKQIRREIYRRTNGKFKVFKDSDDLDMQVVMDSVFDEHAKHLPNQFVRQVKALNKHTVDLIVPNAITQIDQTSKYLKQLDKPIQPMDRPINANNGGRKTLPSFTSVLGF